MKIKGFLFYFEITFRLLIHESEIKRKNLNPKFKMTEFNLGKICQGEYNRKIVI